MKATKFLKILAFINILGLSSVYAADCKTDWSQMKDLIDQYGSIKGQNCGDITMVSNVEANPPYECVATCDAGGGPHNCQWTTGNWGDTLMCTPDK